ncbi:hypothetical protein M9H77_03206 [Catharanthus roseus]|uniref:Uncharacterized protein n=1 Tax=Catharanthus roseus TaxID=4058 RepID=A0ACC0CB12_CATRO|nr:hypothetical protein M9H77_03206 [Catharanthus roseus]
MLQLLILVVMVMTGGKVQQAEAHPCATSFFSALVELIPCRQAVAPFSSWQPTEACCAAVKALGQPCLCVLINGPPISGVDRSLALQLPLKCSVNFEPCKLISSSFSLGINHMVRFQTDLNH